GPAARPRLGAIRATAAPSPRRRRAGTSAGKGAPCRPRSSCRLLREVALAALVEELRAGDNRIDQRAESVVALGQLEPQLGDEQVVRRQQRAAQAVRQELTAQVVQKFIAPALA